MQSDTPDPATLIADLRQRWAHLKDVDRAVRIHQIHLAGLSLRELANELNRSPTLIRRLNDAAQASKLDLLRARTVGISTRKLARRGVDERNLQAKKAQESAELQRKRAVEQVSQAICQWLQREGWSGGQGEQIVDEARFELASAEATDTLPRIPPPQPGTPIEQIVQKMRPPWPVEDPRLPWTQRADNSNWYAQWLARWVYFALPDSDTRHQALESALELLFRVK